MTRRAITSPDLPPPAGPYSHVIDTGALVYTAGFGPQNPTTGELPEGIEAQTRAVIDSLERALSAVDLTLADVVKTTVHLQHQERDFARYNDVYAQRFPAPYPVRTTVGSALNGILVEIDAVAVRSA